jgi:hypothetical protein
MEIDDNKSSDNKSIKLDELRNMLNDNENDR